MTVFSVSMHCLHVTVAAFGDKHNLLCPRACVCLPQILRHLYIYIYIYIYIYKTYHIVLILIIEFCFLNFLWCSFLTDPQLETQ